MKPNTYTTVPAKAVDFLHGNDPEFEKAMNSVNDMYEDLFKTTNYEDGEISDLSNLNQFDSINDMYNGMMGVTPSDPRNNKRDTKHPEEEEEEIVIGEPVDMEYIRFDEPEERRKQPVYGMRETNNNNTKNNMGNVFGAYQYSNPVAHQSSKNPYAGTIGQQQQQLPPVWAPPHKRTTTPYSTLDYPNPSPYNSSNNNPYPF